MIHYDNPTLQITPEKLNDRNFLRWSQAVQLFLAARGKMGYFRGTIKKPKILDPSIGLQEAENSYVISWLINSIQLEVNKHFLLFSIAEEVWDAESWTYLKKGNIACIIELRQQFTLQVERSHCNCRLQQYGGFMAEIGSTATFTDESTRGCNNAGRDVGTRLNL